MGCADEELSRLSAHRRWLSHPPLSRSFRVPFTSPAMVKIPTGSDPPWRSGVPAVRYPALSGHVDVDVAIVGGGITGLTAAYHAAQSGQSVVLVERGRIADAESGRTTGFLTAVLDARLADLVKIHGNDPVLRAWEAGTRAIDQIESIVRDASISCDFKRVDAVLYGPRAKDRTLLPREARVARELGLPVEVADPEVVPFPSQAALRIPRQARFHPRKVPGGAGQGRHLPSRAHLRADRCPAAEREPRRRGFRPAPDGSRSGLGVRSFGADGEQCPLRRPTRALLAAASVPDLRDGGARPVGAPPGRTVLEHPRPVRLRPG